MGKKKSAHGYELELRRMIKSRTGADCEVWLYPQVRATAANMVLLDKISGKGTWERDPYVLAFDFELVTNCNRLV